MNTIIEHIATVLKRPFISFLLFCTEPINCMSNDIMKNPDKQYHENHSGSTASSPCLKYAKDRDPLRRYFKLKIGRSIYTSTPKSIQSTQI